MRRDTPCDIDGICPYCSSQDDYVNCEYWCPEEREPDPDYYGPEIDADDYDL